MNEPISTTQISIPLAEYEALRKDRLRFEWMLPICSCTDDDSKVTDARALRVAAALMLGKSGRDAIDTAMEGSL
jgi:hypothetical protein